MTPQDRRRRPSGQQPRRGQGQARRPAQTQRPQSGPRSRNNARPSGLHRDNTIQFPGGGTAASRPARPAQGRGQAVRYPGGRPAQARPVPRENAVEAARRRRAARKLMRRRRMMRRLAALVLVLGLVAAGGYLTITMLFKISAVRLTGPDGADITEAGPYTSSEILAALGVEVEENIFSFDPAAKAAALEHAFPLLEQIRVERVYPSTVVVRVTPAAPAYAMQTPTGWITLSAGMKILTAEGQQPEGLPVLWGGDPVSVTPGDQLAYALPAAAPSGADSAASASGEAAAPAEDPRLPALEQLLAALEQRGLLADVTRIEYADAGQLAFLYQDRISVLLGTLNELDYKLDYAEYMLLNKEGKGCAETDTGHLDCSHVHTDGSLQAVYAQGAVELPSGYQPAPPQPEAPAETVPEEETAAGAEAAAAAPEEQAADAAQ